MKKDGKITVKQHPAARPAPPDPDARRVSGLTVGELRAILREELKK